jgi:uncharacterized coiled-coil protein SlyX
MISNYNDYFYRRFNEIQGADIRIKVEELNQALRNRDKMKDDAIAQLSDQVMALTARMQEFERTQQMM